MWMTQLWRSYHPKDEEKLAVKEWLQWVESGRARFPEWLGSCSVSLFRRGAAPDVYSVHRKPGPYAGFLCIRQALLRGQHTRARAYSSRTGVFLTTYLDGVGFSLESLYFLSPFMVRESPLPWTHIRNFRLNTLSVKLNPAFTYSSKVNCNISQVYHIGPSSTLFPWGF
jgi:hypothetical protein